MTRIKDLQRINPADPDASLPVFTTDEDGQVTELIRPQDRFGFYDVTVNGELHRIPVLPGTVESPEWPDTLKLIVDVIIADQSRRGKIWQKS